MNYNLRVSLLSILSLVFNLLNIMGAMDDNFPRPRNFHQEA